MIVLNLAVMFFYVIGLIIAYTLMVAVPYFLCGVNTKSIAAKMTHDSKVGSTVLMLAFEALKIAISIILVHFMFEGAFGIDTCSISGGYYWINYAVGISAVLGEIFPIYRKFKGENGIIIAFMAMLAISPITAVVLGAVFGVMYVLSRSFVQSAVVSAVFCPVAVVFYEALIAKNAAWLPDTLIALAIAAVVVIRNIKELKKSVKS